MVRAAIVGCGKIGAAGSPGAAVTSHASAYALHAKVELCGVSDVDAGQRDKASRVWSVPAHQDPIAMCKELAPDVVSIASSTSSHAEIALAILEAAAPKCLFMEKPLARTSREAESILRAAERKKTSICVNYSRRFSPEYRELATQIRGGVFGAPRYARVTYGRGVLNSASHAIDALRMFLGEPKSARGTIATWAAGGPGDDPTYEADMTFDGDVRVHFEPFDSRIATVFEIDFFAEKSRFRATLGGRRIERFDRIADSISEGFAHYVPRAEPDSNRDVLADAMINAVDAIVAHVERGAELPCTALDGMEALRWVEQIRGPR